MALGGLAALAVGAGLQLLGGLLQGTRRVQGRRAEIPESLNDYGSPLERIFGQVSVTGTRVWADKIFVDYTKQSSGGKGGPSVQNETAYGTLAVVFCRGPGKIVALELNGEIVWDSRSTVDSKTRERYDDFFSKHLTLFDGTEDQAPWARMEAAIGEGVTPALRGLVYVGIEDLDLTPYGNSLQMRSRAIVSDREYFPDQTVRDVVGRILEGGLEPGEIETSELVGVSLPFEGYRVGGEQTNPLEILEELGNFYGFFVTQSGSLVVARMRDRPSVLVVDMALAGTRDLSGESQEAGPLILGTESAESFSPLPWERGSPFEGVVAVLISFPDPEQDYAQSPAEARLSTRKGTTLEINSSVVATTGTALSASRLILRRAQGARTVATLQLPTGFSVVDYGDILGVSLGGVTSPWRVIGVSLGSNWMTTLRIQRDDMISGYATPVIAPPTKAAAPLPTLPDLLFIEPPPLRESHVGQAGVYGIPTNGSASASLYSSINGGATYEFVTTLSGVGTVGTTLEELPDSDGGLEELGQLDLELLQGGLESTTEELFLAGGNLAAIQGPSGWELINFRNATLIAPGQYRVSRLIRGARGTECQATGHIPGETFVLLSGYVEFLVGRIADLGNEVRFKILRSGQSLDDVGHLSYTPSGGLIKPLSVENLSGIVSGGSLNLTWTRRSRYPLPFPYDWATSPIGEEREEYWVDIYSQTTGAIVQTLVTYSEAAEVPSPDPITYASVVQVSQRLPSRRGNATCPAIQAFPTGAPILASNTSIPGMVTPLTSPSWMSPPFPAQWIWDSNPSDVGPTTDDVMILEVFFHGLGENIVIAGACDNTGVLTYQGEEIAFSGAATQTILYTGRSLNGVNSMVWTIRNVADGTPGTTNLGGLWFLVAAG